MGQVATLTGGACDAPTTCAERRFAMPVSLDLAA